MKLKITEVENGFVIETVDTLKHNGVYIFKNTDELKMLEFVGEVILDRKLVVTEK